MEKSIASDLYNEVKATLIGIRKGAGLTQRELSARLKKAHSFISKVEQGERRVDVLELYRICKVCKRQASKVLLGLIKRFDALDRGHSR